MRKAFSGWRLVILAAVCTVPMLVHGEEKDSQPGTKWTAAEIERAVAPMRAGKKLTPGLWPNGARIAVCLSWDMDNESANLATGDSGPISLSIGEYGDKEALARILSLYDRQKIPGSFYIPTVTGLL